MENGVKGDVQEKPACQDSEGCKQEFQNPQPFKVNSDDVLGRYLMATKDIPRSEVILKEPPLLWGPSQETIPVCLGCGEGLEEGSCIPCSMCGWPVCNEHCEKAPAHQAECRFTQMRGDKVSISNFGIVHPSYGCITVLRCLYQKKYNEAVWKRLECLESHCEERKSTDKYQREKVSVVNFILNFFKLRDMFSEEEILKVCGIVMVNAHEVPLAEPPYVAIYEKTSMFEHDCSANCAKSFTNFGGIVITTGQDVKIGDHLSICYADPLWGTANRRYFLNETKFFWCSCSRCSDPTEFGTYFSAVRCQNKNCEGYLLPKTFLTAANEIHNWYCNKCDFSVSSNTVQHLLDKIGEELTILKKEELKACEKFVTKFERFLHPNHYYLTDVKMAIIHLTEERPGGLFAAPDKELEVRVKYCKGLVDLVLKLTPSEKRLRGLLLFGLYTSLKEIEKRKRNDPDLNLEFEAAMESENALKECIELLQFEPDSLPEGQIYKQAIQNMNDLDGLL